MSSSGASVLGTLVGLAICGVGAWGSCAIGSALGMYGMLGFVAGAGIIAGGILAVGVACVGLYCVGYACKSAFTRTRDYFRSLSAERAARREQALQNTSTRNINQQLNNGLVGTEANKPAVTPPYVAPVLYPPLYQQTPGRVEERDNPYYAPPVAYRPY